MKRNYFVQDYCLQAKIQKHEAFEAEVHAHSNAIAQLDKTGTDMIQHQHFASDIIKVNKFPVQE